MNKSDLFLKNELYISIENLYNQGNLPHALLFLSIDEFTNLEFSKKVAFKIACNSNEDYLKANIGTHPDILSYPKAKQNISVIDMAEIYDKIQIKPILSKNKVFILNNFDMATEQAQNKILKLLEEPPKNVFLILNGTNENKILNTILSRVQKRYIPKESKETAISYALAQLSDEKFNTFEKDQIESIYNLSDGYVGDILKIVHSESYKRDYEFVKQFVYNCKNSTLVADYLNYINKDNIIPILTLLSKVYGNLMIESAHGKSNNDYSLTALANIIRHLNQCKKMYDSNVSLSALTEYMLLKIMEIKNLCK